ncbi:pilus assembly protein PilP [Salinicola halophyticus]|uniref:pilus assembly protein PilP n=1 Tax=Salinicola halophyticus TaxID=1808881 RepID=UPI000DA1AE03|nr:pilus assembly protein PilP [Salinicola halophyticus]
MRSKYSRLAGLMVGLFIGGGLAGCESADLASLQAHLDTLRHKPQGQIASLPEMPGYLSASYDQGSQRSPFVAEQVAEPGPEETAPLPDAERPRQPLEAFELDSLSLVGTLTVGKTPSALVAAPDGRVHRLFRGNYLGRDYGRIVSVEPRGLTLVETVRDSAGGWTERRQQLEMAKQESDGASRRQSNRGT